MHSYSPKPKILRGKVFRKSELRSKYNAVEFSQKQMVQAMVYKAIRSQQNKEQKHHSESD